MATECWKTPLVEMSDPFQLRKWAEQAAAAEIPIRLVGVASAPTFASGYIALLSSLGEIDNFPARDKAEWLAGSGEAAVLDDEANMLVLKAASDYCRERNSLVRVASKKEAWGNCAKHIGGWLNAFATEADSLRIAVSLDSVLAEKSGVLSVDEAAEIYSAAFGIQAEGIGEILDWYLAVVRAKYRKDLRVKKPRVACPVCGAKHEDGEPCVECRRRAEAEERARIEQEALERKAAAKREEMERRAAERAEAERRRREAAERAARELEERRQKELREAEERRKRKEEERRRREAEELLPPAPVENLAVCKTGAGRWRIEWTWPAGMDGAFVLCDDGRKPVDTGRLPDSADSKTVMRGVDGRAAFETMVDPAASRIVVVAMKRRSREGLVFANPVSVAVSAREHQIRCTIVAHPGGLFRRKGPTEIVVESDSGVFPALVAVAGRSRIPSCAGDGTLVARFKPIRLAPDAHQAIKVVSSFDSRLIRVFLANPEADADSFRLLPARLQIR